MEEKDKRRAKTICKPKIWEQPNVLGKVNVTHPYHRDYSAIKENEPFIHTMAWMDFKGIMLNEKKKKNSFSGLFTVQHYLDNNLKKNDKMVD